MILNHSCIGRTICSKWINDIAGPSTYCPADVIFAVDESTSVGTSNFNVIKSFLSQFVGRLRLQIDNGNTRVGLLKFASVVDTVQAFNLDAHSSTAAVQSAIRELSYTGGRTNTAGALRYVRTDMLTSAAGDRPDVLNVVIVMTDGKSNVNPTQTPVSTVRKLMKNFLISETVLNCLPLIGACCIKSPYS